MKYILFIYLFLPFVSNCQKVTFGVAGSYGTEIERSGINLGVGYFVRGNSSLDIGFTKFLDKEWVVRNFDLQATSWIMDLEFLQYFFTNEVVSIFVIAGVNWTNYTIEIYESGTFIGENNAASGPGLIYGIGVDFGKHDFIPLVEIKYQTGFDQWVVNLGVKYTL